MTTPQTAAYQTVSFNQWLSFQRNGPYALLAQVWVTSRGRLTRNTVIDRAMALGIPYGGEAYDAYLAAIGR